MNSGLACEAAHHRHLGSSGEGLRRVGSQSPPYGHENGGTKMSRLGNEDGFTTAGGHQKSGYGSRTQQLVHGSAPTLVPFARAQARDVMRAVPAWAPLAS